MTRAFYSVFFLLISEILFSQTGTPFIKNFSPEEYHAEGQIWCAEQDNNGIMYFGSNSEILIYDGNSWQAVKLPNNSPVRSLCRNEEGTIFVGSVGEFGYLTSDIINGFKYISLSEQSDNTTGTFSDVWTMKSTGENVWFAANEALFRYNPKKKPAVIKVKTKEAPFLLYKAGTDVFVSFRGKGTYKLKGDSIISVKGLEQIHPWFMLPYGNTESKIIGNLNGLTIYNPNASDSVKNFFNKISVEKTNKFLNLSQLYTGAADIGHGRFAIGTLRNGVVIIDKTGKIINIINEEKGLQSNTIHSLFKDKQNELWASSAYGISRIDINSPYELFNKNDGIKGSIYDVLRFHNQLYVTSNLGLYYYTKTGFKGVENLSGKNALQILSPFIFKTETDSLLFVNTIYGMYRIDNNRPIKINSINYNSIIQSDFNKNTTYLTINYDLYKMVYKNHSFSLPEKIKKFDELVYIGYEIDKENLILILNEKAVLYNLKNKSSVDINANAKITDINKIDNKIFAYTDKGLFIYNPEENRFFKDSIYTTDIKKDSEVLQFEKFSENNFWLLARQKDNNNLYVARIFKNNGTYFTETNPFKRFSGLSIIHEDGDSLLWAVNSKILYKYKVLNHKNFKQKEQCLIRSVKIKTDSLIFNGIYSSENKDNNTDNEIIIDYSSNDIYFNFTLTSYDGDKNKFSYKLEKKGETKEWSNPTDINFKEYNNLREGIYFFSVKGINVYGIESEPVKYTFEILPPWYRTTPAYITYIFLLILLIKGFVKLNAKRLEQENIRLDNIVKDRTAELLTQKEEIQTQADYLEEVNNELNQKNEEISSIADNLKEANTKIKEKNKYITDSINYAQKIQNAVLPSDQEISKHISDYFIIYKPKDIVSGDFYFIKKRGIYLIPAVADCTGHGVPGGFLAMMGVALLSDIVQNEEIKSPAAALEEMRRVVKRSLHQTKYLDSQSEGIEIALCAINTKNLSLEFAGANHPLFIVREKNGEPELIEISADAQPVGIHYKEKPFKLNKFQLQENDMLYMFSDGYFDQFGGPNKKKFLLKNLTNLLKEVSGESVKIQKRKILNAFNSWKGNNKQVDDVLLFGIRVKNF